MPPKPKVLLSQLRTVGTLWPEVREERMPIDRWLGNYFYKNRKRYGSRDRRFISETIYALFRHKTLISLWHEVLQSQGGGNDGQSEIILAAAIEGFLAVEQFCELYGAEDRQALEQAYARLRKRQLPVNFEKLEGVDLLAKQYSFPSWLIERWQVALPKAQMAQFLESQNVRPPFVVRANPLRVTREKLLNLFQGQGYEVSACQLSSHGIQFRQRANLFGTDEFKKGYFEVQDEGSQLVAEVIEPKESDVVWDVCAGGGGKSLALAALMGNKGRIIATDIRPKKLQDLKKRAKRAGAFNIFPAELSRIGESKVMKSKVDKILIDAPCSGTGTLRRNPDVKWKLTPEQFKEQSRIQKEIIEKALPYLKASGRLYYVTCSIDVEENESVIRDVLDRFPDLSRVPVVKTELGARHGLSIQTQSGSMQLWPHEHGTDGFFLSILEHKPSSKPTVE